MTAQDRAGSLPKNAKGILLPTIGMIPHVAVGGPWKTLLTVVNDHPTRAMLTELDFWTSSGTRMNVTLSSGTQTYTGNSFTILLPPLGTVRLETVQTPPQVQTGWVDVYNESIQGTVYAVFRASVPNRQDFESLVTMEWSINDALLVPFDNRNGFGTAVAVANGWSSTSLVFQAEIYDNNGGRIGVYQETIGPRSQVAFQTADRWTETRNRAGLILLRKVSGTGLGALSLLFNPTGSVTTIPAIDLRVN